MTYREEILQQALALPPADRAFVAAALEESLPPDALDAASADAVSGSELLAELQRRSAAYKNGTMAARPAADVIAELRRAPNGRARAVNLRILSAAETEIVEAREYLEGKAAGLGGRFVDDLAQALYAVAQQPLRFRKVETLPDDQPYRRALLSVFRYAVVFEILTDEILVVAVCHTSREPNYWLARRMT